MTIYFGADHRGFKLKETLKAAVQGMGHEVVDLGAEQVDPNDDYPDFAAAVAKEVSTDPEQKRGVVLCGSGAGADITANRFKKVRSVLGISPDQVYAARHDDDANVLALSSDFTSEADAKKMLTVFLATPFGDANRFLRRIEKIDELSA